MFNILSIMACVLCIFLQKNKLIIIFCLLCVQNFCSTHRQQNITKMWGIFVPPAKRACVNQMSSYNLQYLSKKKISVIKLISDQTKINEELCLILSKDEKLLILIVLQNRQTTQHTTKVLVVIGTRYIYYYHTPCVLARSSFRWFTK